MFTFVVVVFVVVSSILLIFCDFCRKQFSRPVVPSIPAWQLTQRTIGGSESSAHNDGDKNDDNGSADGSNGSSETEVVTKHSDSSLELM